ncbi:HD domain-containing protein [Haloimpatiens lingqiaonensis]|uniref:HD domain-containing protein n=1 Tax=Haloimpatiens lingqiaonensis TaxID=1380675 RepID=UPI0010FD3579|nr:HD domain-containing protein [Haloimpatiens lingqiaonensis]
MNLKTTMDMFKEIDRHLLEDKIPSEYILEISNEQVFNEEPFNMLKNLKDTPQSPKYHPEGSVWNHTMLVLDKAAEIKEDSKDKRVFMWAALLHDLGKAPTTKTRKGKITSYNHDNVGEEMARKFLEKFHQEERFTYKVCKLVRWHMQPLFILKDLPFADPENMLKEVDIDEIALLFLCDRLGRGGDNKEREIEEKNNAENFIKKVKNVQDI